MQIVCAAARLDASAHARRLSKSDVFRRVAVAAGHLLETRICNWRVVTNHHIDHVRGPQSMHLFDHCDHLDPTIFHLLLLLIDLDGIKVLLPLHRGFFRHWNGLTGEIDHYRFFEYVYLFGFVHVLLLHDLKERHQPSHWKAYGLATANIASTVLDGLCRSNSRSESSRKKLGQFRRRWRDFIFQSECRKTA